MIYYIDTLNGNDNHDGLSTITPWKNYPSNAASGTVAGAAWASQVSNGNKWLPGTVFRFNSARTYDKGLLIRGSGSGNDPVIYDGTWWGGGRCEINFSNVVGNGMVCYPNGANHNGMTIQGFKFHKIGGYAEDDPVWDEPAGGWDPPVYDGNGDMIYKGDAKVNADLPKGAGIGIKREASNVIIRDCIFDRIGVWQNTKPLAGNRSVTGYGVLIEEDSTNILVEDCDFTRMGSGVTIKSAGGGPTTNVTVRNCAFHNYMNWLIEVSPRTAGATFTNITIENNTLYDYKELDRPNWTGWGDKPHQDGIFLRSAGIRSSWNNVVVRNNLFYADDTSDGGTASIYISQGPSAHIYNNVFYDDDHNVAHIDVGYSNTTGENQVVRIHNNTCVGSTRLISIGSMTPASSIIDVRNNLFYRTVTGDYNTATYDVNADLGANLIWDYNLHASNNSPIDGENGTKMVFRTGSKTFAQWQALGFDTNGKCEAPQLVSVSGDPSTWDGKLTSGSPARGAGVDLGTFFTTDHDGNTRTAWDIGAFEYDSEAPVPNVPPVADAGLDIEVTLPTSTASLDGTGSSDSDGYITTWAWTQLSGPNTAGLADADTETPDLSGLIEGTYEFQLTVTDDAAETDTDTVIVTVLPATVPDAPTDLTLSQL